MNVMDRIWNWLMHTNAKALFVMVLLVFIGVSLWRGWVEIKALRLPDPASAAPSTPSTALALPPYRELGLLKLVSNQLARAGSSIPVNPFRPAYDDLVAEWVDATEAQSDPVVPPEPTPEAIAAQRERVAAVERERIATQERERDPRWGLRRRDGTAPGDGQPPPPPGFGYRGLFRRPDGRMAAWIFDTATQQTRFYSTGDKLHGFTVLDADMRTLTLQEPDGAERRLALGETHMIGADPEPEPEP